MVIISATPWWVKAQSADDSWSLPINLSHSGAATNPAIVIDSDADVHVVWQDNFENYVYTKFDGSQWRAPQPTSLHILFGALNSQSTSGQSQTTVNTFPSPLFISGPSGYVIAFWINPEGYLYASRVPNRDFADIAAWDEARLLSFSAASLAAAIDVRGIIHLAFFRTDEDPEHPAGIYYMRSRNNGLDWSSPTLLYQSPYLRGLDSEQANLSLAAAGTVETPILYIAWDNRPRKQVFMAKSADGGASWDQLLQVTGPTPDSGSARPFNIRIGATQNSAVLVWQSGGPGGLCTQFFRSSGDGGGSWSEEQRMIEDVQGCAKKYEFVASPSASPSGYLYLLTNINSQIFLTAWDGLQWSEPLAQPILSGFEDDETYTEVAFDCHKAAFSGELLYIVGCDSSGGGDIWAISRQINSTASWFSPPVWRLPAPVTSDTLETTAVKLVATRDGLFHAFFSQRQDPAIYHARWDGEKWSRLNPVLQLPEGEAGWPAVAVGPGNELFLIARSSNGSFYFSMANSSDALTASRWLMPTQLQIAHEGNVGSADVAWDSAGRIFIAYSVPVNDARGIYLVQSKDNGQTWSKPLQVFDGAKDGFDFVGSPSLLASANGFLHIIWTRLEIQAEGVSQPRSIYYARSEDAGVTFGEVEQVLEAPVAWREVVSDGKGNLHLIWQRPDILTTLWDQFSSDDGHSWQDVSLLSSEGGAAAVTVDIAGRFHLLDIGRVTLNHWLWDERRWQAEAPLRWSLASQHEDPVQVLAAAVNKDGEMVVLLAASTETGSSPLLRLFYTIRTVDLPPELVTNPQALIESSPSATYIPTTPTPEPSFTLSTEDTSESARLQSTTDRIDTRGPLGNFTGVLITVALFILGALGVLALISARTRPR